MEAFAYFPAIVYRDERPDLIGNILPLCIKELDRVRDPQASMVQSDSLIANPLFEDISKYLLESSVNILRWQGYNVDQYDFYLSSLWAQEVKNGVGTNVHVHKNSQICGWFFLETPENGAYPLYYDTRANKSMVELDFVQGEDISNATNLIHFNNMVPGSALFSNSWMQHQLVGSVSHNPTRCIHFVVSHKERLCNTN